MINAKNIEKHFGELTVLNGINLDIKESEIVSVVGASGAGKTTLLQILGTLLPFDKGIVKINGTDVSGLREKSLARFRNENIGFVFQFHHLLPEFTALENVCIPGFISGLARSKVEQKAKELLSQVGLKDRLHHYPNQLSGGEQQRVGLARAFIHKPEILFADEPTGNLDSETGEQIEDLLFTLNRESGTTLIIVTHDRELAEKCDRIIELKSGEIFRDTGFEENESQFDTAETVNAEIKTAE